MARVSGTRRARLLPRGGSRVPGKWREAHGLLPRCPTGRRCPGRRWLLHLGPGPTSAALSHCRLNSPSPGCANGCSHCRTWAALGHGRSLLPALSWPSLYDTTCQSSFACWLPPRGLFTVAVPKFWFSLSSRSIPGELEHVETLGASPPSSLVTDASPLRVSEGKETLARGWQKSSQVFSFLDLRPLQCDFVLPPLKKLNLPCSP